MSKERELLERAYYVLGELSYAMLKDSGEYNLAGDIYEFLSTPEQTQDEEPVAWFSLTSKTFSTVETSHHTAPLFLHPTPPPEPTHDEGPNKEKALELAHRWCSRYRHGEEFPYLFNEYHLLEFVRRLHPTSRPEFVRLSEEEIERLMDSALAPKEIDERDLHYFARAIEDALEEKNK